MIERARGWTSISSVFGFSLMITFLSGCGAGTRSVVPSTRVAPPAKITDGFTVLVEGDKPSLKIQKAALDKEYLLQASVIEQPIAAMGTGVKSRIVAFKRYGGELFLLEATQGHTVTTDLPQKLVLASFPILSEDETSIQFDFNRGMSNLFVTSDWYAHDASGREYSPSMQFMRVRHSYLEDARTDDHNRLRIRQVAMLEAESYGGLQGINVEARYYLSPYRPDPDYVAVESSDMRNHGFFEINPQLQTDGSTLVHATRFHPNKPIVFAVSANTPAPFKRAVKDGVKYWASLFAPGQLTVIDAPAGVTAPDADFHVVQWVPHDFAGMAYADGQMDPRTGQLTHGQIYLTSAFAFIGKADARRLLRRGKKTPTPKTRIGSIGLAGFDRSVNCEYNATDAMSSGVARFFGEADESAILQAAQDYVRAVTAHEVGHVLGLRHNFAGSLSVQNYELAGRRQRFAEYLNGNDPAENVIPSSSVMDYLPFEEDVFVGSRIRRYLKPLEYDAKAIQALYQGKKFRRGEIPLFCTDTQVGRYVDCQRFDAGASLIEFSTLSSNWAVEDLAHTILETYIEQIAPLRGDLAKEVEEVSFEPTSVARLLIGSKGDVVGGFGDSSKFLAIHNRHPYFNELNKEEVREEEFKYIASEVVRLGGLETTFSLVKKDYYELVQARIAQLLNEGGYRSGVGLAGQTYNLSSAEVDTILAMTDKLMKKLPEALVKVDLETLGKIPNTWKLENNPLSTTLAQLMAKRMEEYVLQVKADEQPIETEVELPVVALGKKEPEPGQPTKEKVTVKLPQFFYSVETRSKAGPLLKAPDGEKGISWGVVERNSLRARFEKMLNDACGCKIEKVKIEEVKVADAAKNQATTRWFVENKKVFDAIK